MDTDKPTEKEQDNSFAHVVSPKKEKDPKTYDPDRYLPSATDGGEYEEGVPLEQAEPGKGYSTDPAQGKWSASLQLADEDMDRRPENPEDEARNLQESYEKSKANTRREENE